MKKHTINYIIAFLLGILITSIVFYESNFFDKDKIIVKEISAEILKGESEIVAVNNQGNGLIGNVNVEISDGDGKILINTNPFVEPDTQYSAITAVKVAENFTNVNLDNKNIIFDFGIGLKGNETGLIGGPSAGVAMTIATIAAIEGKIPKKSIVMTGTILPDGKIGWIGGIIEKGQAAVDLGKQKFLIPKGQDDIKYYEKQVTKKYLKNSIIYTTKYIPKELNVIDYFNEKFLSVKEVETINDVANEVFNNYQQKNSIEK